MEQGFHFIRPLWLLLVPLGPLLLWWWHRRNDPIQRWKGMIAPHLLKHLVVGDHGAWSLRPIHLVCAVLMLGGIACAGPTWELDPPPFAQDRAPMVVALDLSPAMDAIDVPPTRLERVKQKIHDLVKLRGGGRIGLIVYTDTAHMVLPPTDDPALMDLFVSSLSTDLLPGKGQNAAAALATADRLLAAEDDPGTIVFFTSGFDDAQIPAFVAHRKNSRQQVLMLAVGTTEGGPLKSPDGSLVTESNGGPVESRLDDAALERLSSKADVPLASVTSDNADMRWVQREAVHHLQMMHDDKSTMHWKEYGYYLCYPLVLLALLWFRRGWMVRWMFVIGALGLTGLPRSASAFDDPASSTSVSDTAASTTAGSLKQTVIGWFATPDQQGRWYYEHGEYGKAAAHFQNPYWKGLSLYQYGRWDEARAQFETLNDADAVFMVGNCYANRTQYEEARDAYNQALQMRHPFAEAEFNLVLMAKLIKQREDAGEPDKEGQIKPDEMKFDKEGKKGKGQQKVMGMKPATLPADVWMRNLSVSPADFLRTKFSIESQSPAKVPAKPVSAPAPPAEPES